MHIHLDHPHVLYILKKDPYLKTLFDTVREVHVTFFEDGFSFLIFTITGQQVSTKVAEKVYQRLLSLVDVLTPESLLKLEDDSLRKVGLSYRKIETMKRLASYVLDKAHPSFSWYDEKDVSGLIDIKGIGPWTLDMYYMFVLKRLDYFSFLDLGLIKALEHVYEVPVRDISHMKQIIEGIAPYQSILAHYLWAYWDHFHQKKKVEISSG